MYLRRECTGELLQIRQSFAQFEVAVFTIQEYTEDGLCSTSIRDHLRSHDVAQ